MNVFLTVYNTSSWQILVNSIGLSVTDSLPASAKESCAFSPPQTLSSLSKLVEQSPNTQQIWIAAVQAEHFIAEAIDNGQPLANAARDWEQLTNDLLGLQSKHRKTIKLFNLHQALAQPALFSEHLGAINIAEYPAQSYAHRFSLLVASQHLNQQLELKTLNTLLQASALPLCESESLVLDVDAILQQNFLCAAELSTTRNQLDQALEKSQRPQEEDDDTNNNSKQLINIRAERDLILAQLHQAQEQLEVNSNLHKKQLSEVNKERDLLLAQLRQAQEQYEIKANEQTKHLSDVSAERDTIIAQLHQTQEKLEANSNAHAKQLSEANTERDLLLAQLRQAQEQYEIKANEQAKHLSDVSAERDTIIAQLHQAQEKLEANSNAHAKQLSEANTERDLIISQLHQAHEEYEIKANEQAKHLSDVSAERDTIIAQLHQTQEKLEANSNAHAKQLSEANKERDLLLAQLRQAQEQYEIKTNEQAKHLSDISEERDIVIAQLHQTQEELEKYFFALNKEKENNNKTLQEIAKKHDIELSIIQNELKNIEILTTEIYQLKSAQQTTEQLHKHALLARDKQHSRDIAKIENELRKTKARAASAEFAGQLIQQELEKLRDSISWKAATPVRAIGRLIKKPDVQRDKLLQEIGLLLTSEYFDVEWYLQTYTDVRESKINPAEHYLLFGAKEGRLPGPLFDGNWYLQHYPDVAAANLNPLLHFIMYGQQEGRTSSPKLLTNNQNSAE